MAPFRRPPWSNRLGVKLAVAIGFVSVVSAGVMVWLVVSVQKRYLIDEVVRGAARFSDTIKATTYHNMLDNRWDAAYRSMRTVGNLTGIEKVRMMNKEGRITFSTDEREIGRSVDKRAEACYACHAAGQPLVRLNLPSRSRIFRSGDERVLGMVTPIYNEPGCSTAACHVHPAGRQVLGVVDIAISLGEIDREVADLGRTTVLIALGMMVVLVATVVLFARRTVVRPVAELVRGTRRIARMELDEEIAFHRSDEIGMLATSFNEMTGSLRQARQRLNDLNASLERQVEERTDALRQAQAQLIQSEKLSSLGRLAASVAHEINNPLAGILTYAKLLIRMHEEGESGEQFRERSVRNLRLVQRETERCTAIVRNLLDFARQRPLILKEADVNAVIGDALDLLGNRLSLQGIALSPDLRPLPPVKADFGQLRQAIVNIVLNASDAMATGGTLTVATRPVDGGAQVEVAIVDTGVGIPPDHFSKILDPFFTTKEKGTGLGLSVVYGIVERHGGRLDIKSQIGEGTTVTIRLPAVRAENDGGPPPRPDGGGPEGA